MEKNNEPGQLIGTCGAIYCGKCRMNVAVKEINTTFLMETTTKYYCMECFVVERAKADEPEYVPYLLHNPNYRPTPPMEKKCNNCEQLCFLNQRDLCDECDGTIGLKRNYTTKIIKK